MLIQIICVTRFCLALNDLKIESILSTVLYPVGKLGSAVRHWEDSRAYNQVLENICDGYKLSFKTIPSQVSLRNIKSARENPEFVRLVVEKVYK